MPSSGPLAEKVKPQRVKLQLYVRALGFVSEACWAVPPGLAERQAGLRQAELRQIGHGASRRNASERRVGGGQRKRLTGPHKRCTMYFYLEKGGGAGGL